MQKRMGTILERMEREYGKDLTCYLDHDSAWQLLIATIMSAQCTDKRVNEVTKTLFKKYPSLEKFSKADLLELEEDIKSVGFYHNKAVNIIGCATKLVRDFDSKVPSDIESLTSLPGVGRKTANVVRSYVFGEPSVVVDTHVLRISNRLGLVSSNDPVKVEFELMKKADREYWTYINHWFIAFGRTICKAVNPSCENCYLKDICVDKGKKKPH